MNIFSSKKIIWSIVAFIGIATIWGGVMYFIAKNSREDAIPPQGAEETLPALSGAASINSELLKTMSVTASSTPVKSVLSPQQAKNIKDKISAAPNAKSSVRAGDRQKLLDSMSVQ